MIEKIIKWIENNGHVLLLLLAALFVFAAVHESNDRVPSPYKQLDDQ